MELTQDEKSMIDNAKHDTGLDDLEAIKARIDGCEWCLEQEDCTEQIAQIYRKQITEYRTILTKLNDTH